MMKRILIAVISLSMADLCPMDSWMQNLAQNTNPEDIQRALGRIGQWDEALRIEHREPLTRGIEAANATQLAAIRNLEAGRIGQRQYDLIIEQERDKRVALQADLAQQQRQEARSAELVGNVFGVMTEGVKEYMHEENTRKTKIVTAAATAAAGQKEANKGLLAIAQHNTSQEVLLRTGLTIVGVGAGLVVAYYGTKFACEYAQQFIGMPELVRESSDKGMWEKLANLFGSGPKETFSTIVLPADIKASVERVAASTKIIAQHNREVAKEERIPHRGVLLYGPPGTGKTMIAKAIARESKTSYAIMSGSDFSQFKEGEDVHQLHMAFDRAEQGNGDFIFFFDEVDGFLLKREMLDARGRKLLLAFLARTGAKTNVKIFIATNRPQDLDTAVLSRMSEHIHVGLPKLEERITLLNQYLNMYYGIDNTTGATIAPEIDRTSLIPLAKRLERFSGRDIEDIVGLVQDQLLLSQQKIITLDIVNAAANEKMQQKKGVHSYKEDEFSDLPVTATPHVAVAV